MQIGADIARKGLDDHEQILPLLHSLGRATFYTRDFGFYQRRLCHAAYFLVVLDVDRDKVASAVRKLLKHASFDTRAKRLGKVLRVTESSIRYWQVTEQEEHFVEW